MIKKISDIFKEKEKTFSFEFYPPKTDKGLTTLLKAAESFMAFNPDFFTVTHGAGGSVRDDKTLQIVLKLQKEFNITTMHHLTCIGHSKDDLRVIIEKFKKEGVKNILALRGDPPKDVSKWTPHAEGLTYTYQLIDLIKTFGDDFSIGAAGFPEGHIDCPDKKIDAKYLKMKIDHGAEFIITQLFFSNNDYFDYIDRLRQVNVASRIIPGMIPITNYETTLRFCKICGATVTPEVHEIFKPIKDNLDSVLDQGILFAVKQCRELIQKGAPGIHFYTLNKSHPTVEILKQIKDVL